MFEKKERKKERMEGRNEKSGIILIEKERKKERKKERVG